MTIHFICNNELIKPKLKAYFEEQNIAFRTYNFQKEKPKQVPYLLIVEPFRIREDYYSIHKIWQTYFVKQGFTEMKIIVAGFYECSCNNYLNLLKVPNNFWDWKEILLSLENGWCIGDTGFNREVTRPMKNFFKGHDQRSLFQKLNYWQQSVKNIHYAIQGEINKTYAQAIKRIFPLARRQWIEFQNRWRNYHIFFTCCPFALEKKSIIRLLNQIGPYFEATHPSEELFYEVKCMESLEQIRNELKKMDGYVRPEIYD